MSLTDLYLRKERLPLFLGDGESERDAQPFYATTPNQDGSEVVRLAKGSVPMSIRLHPVVVYPSGCPLGRGELNTAEVY